MRYGVILKGMPTPEDPLLTLAHQAIARLERLSADSQWAHKASGLRGALLRCMEQVELGQMPAARLEELVAQGFEIVENAARDMGDRP